MADNPNNTSTPLVLGLLFLLLLLLVLLFFLYKYLNRQTNGQYTIQRFVYGEGGLRDRVLQGIEIVEGRINTYRQSQTPDEEEAVEDVEDEDEEEENEDAAQGQSQNECNEKENDEDHEDDSSDDYSSIDLRERVNKNKGAEVEKKEEVQKEESKDGGAEDDQKQEEDVKNEERVGLLIDLKSFSGSAIWSEETKEEGNVTAL